MEGSVQQMVKQVFTFDGKKAGDFLEWSFMLRVSLSLYHKSTFNIVQGSQRPSELDNDQVTAREAWDDANQTFTSSFSSLHLAQLSLSCGVSRERRERREWDTDQTHR